MLQRRRLSCSQPAQERSPCGGGCSRGAGAVLPSRALAGPLPSAQPTRKGSAPAPVFAAGPSKGSPGTRAGASLPFSLLHRSNPSPLQGHPSPPAAAGLTGAEKAPSLGTPGAPRGFPGRSGAPSTAGAPGLAPWQEPDTPRLSPAPRVGGSFPEDGELKKGKAWSNPGLPAIYSSVPACCRAGERYFKAAARKLVCLPGFVVQKCNYQQSPTPILHHLQPSAFLTP